jgi:PAS domain S-box-containing protein
MHTITRDNPLLRDRNSHLCLYRSILDHMRDVVILVDPVGMVVYLNPAGNRLLGSLRLASTLDALFAAVHPDDVAALRSAVDEAMSGGLTPATVAHRCRAALGGWSYYETQVQRLLSEGVDTVLIVCRDVTVQRAQEDQRSEGHAFEVAAHASGAVARDFGALLLSLGRHLDVLAGTPPANLPAELRELRETLDSAWRFVDQLQSFGSTEAHSPQVEVNDTLEELSPHLQRLAGPSIDVIQLLGATAGRIGMSRAELEELLSTLVLRARDAVRAALAAQPRELAGPGRVVIVTSDVDAGAARNRHQTAGDLMLELTDTGIPMTAEQRAEIESGATGDTDLRLARVRALAEKAGGRITVESAGELGTTIRLRWPVSRAPEAPIE